MTPAEYLALAASIIRGAKGLMEAAEAAQGEPLTDEQRAAVLEGKELANDRWESLAP